MYESGTYREHGLRLGFLFINDGSKDNTLQQMIKLHNEDPQHYSYVDLSRNFGKELSIQVFCCI